MTFCLALGSLTYVIFLSFLINFVYIIGPSFANVYIRSFTLQVRSALHALCLHAIQCEEPSSARARTLGVARIVIRRHVSVALMAEAESNRSIRSLNSLAVAHPPNSPQY